MKIIIIQHENDFDGESGVYFIEMIAKSWREAGHDVIFVNGIQHNIKADLALLHINLSVVPDEYAEYAKQFPVVLNKDVKDIRKRTISQNLIDQNDAYEGPVIVKTDLNAGGLPESKIYDWKTPKMPSLMSVWRTFIRRVRNLAVKLNLVDPNASRLVQTEYRESFQMFKNKKSVPNYIWNSEDWVVEKFIPEVEDSVYVIRNAYFLGDLVFGFKNISDDSIIKDEGKGEIIDVPQAVREYREQIGLDYGKIDYVLKGEKAEILDVTKTVGGAYDREFAEKLAPGVEVFLGQAQVTLR